MMRGALAGLAATVALLAGAGSALADAATLSVTTSTGQPDSVAYIPRVFTLSGTGTPGRYLFVKHRAAGGAPCASSAFADSGTFLDGSFYGVPMNGAFSMQRVLAWRVPGSWMLCYWFAGDQTTVATPITQIVSVRAPPGNIVAAVTPNQPKTGEYGTITVSGTTEAPRQVYAKLRAADGTPCAPTFDADPGGSMISGWSVEGAFNIPTNLNDPVLGQWMICMWLAGTSDDQLPVAASSQVFSVVRARPVVVSSVVLLNCRTGSRLTRVRPKKVKSVCLRYRFSSAPLAGEHLSVSFVTPKRRVYKSVGMTSRGGRSQTLTKAALPVRAYRNRRGTWRAILRMDRHQLSNIRFKVAR